MSVGHAAKSVFGHLLRGIKAGDEKLAGHQFQTWREVKIESPAFLHNAPIPRRFSQEGENVSPALQWGDVPPGTQELVLLCEDPDAPFPQPFLHWIAFGIPPTVSGLPEGVPQVARAGFGMMRQGKNSAKTDGYTGPMPPVGHGVHHYYFQLFAVDRKLDLGDDPTRDELAALMTGHILARGELIGTYERK